MEISNEFMEEYKKCVKRRKTVSDTNQKIRKRVRLLNAIFALFFLCIGFLYYRPKYIPGFRDEELDTIVQAEYIHIVSQGWKNKNEIDSYLTEYRYQKSFSYLTLGDQIYRIDEISSLLKEHRLFQIIYIPAEAIIPVAKRIIQSFMSIIIILEDSGNGVFRIEHIGNVLGNAVWIASLYLFYWLLMKFYYLCRTSPFSSPNTIHYNMNQPKINDIIESPKWVYINSTEDYDGPKVVLFEDMAYIINHPIKIDTPPIVYSILFPFMFVADRKYE